MSSSIKALTPKQERTFTAIGAIMLVAAMVLNLFMGTFSFAPVKAQELGSMLITSVNGENVLPATYEPVNGITVNGEQLSVFDFHIFTETLNTDVHTHGNIAVENMEIATEFGTRYQFNIDTPNISYIGNINEWIGAAVAEAFVFGPNVKVVQNGNQTTIYGAVLDGNGQPVLDGEGNVVHQNKGHLVGNNVGDHVYSSYNNPKYIDVPAELAKATRYSQYLASLTGDVNYTKDDITGLHTATHILNVGGERGDTVVLNIAGEDLASYVDGSFEINNTAGKRIIINVDMSNVGDTVDLGSSNMLLDGMKNGEEVCQLDCNVLWNFHTGSSGAYTGKIVQKGVWMGTMLAPQAFLEVGAVNGSMIAKRVETDAETHKWDYTGDRAIKSSTEVTVRKYWVDRADDTTNHPDVIINLLQNGNIFRTQTLNATQYDSANRTKWEYTFTDLPTTDSNGNTYQYKVEEVMTPEVSSEYHSTVVGNSIVNKFKNNERVELRIQKEWIGQSSSQQLAFNVYKNGELLTTVRRAMQNNGETAIVNIQNTTLYKYADDGSLNIYTVEEEPISGYVLTDSTVDTTIVGDTIQYTYKFVNAPEDNTKGNINVEKIVQYRGENYPVNDVFYVSLFDTNNNLVETKNVVLNNSASGTVRFANIDAGQYFIRETAADGSELPSSFNYDVNVSNNGNVSVSAGSAASVVITNNIKESSISANFQTTKIDAADSSLLAGAVFELYNANTNEYIAGTTSTDQGIISFANLSAGNYYIREQDAPEGYLLNSARYYFAVTPRESGTTITEMRLNSLNGEPVFAIANERETGAVTILKLDLSGSQALEGAQFDLYKNGIKYNTEPLVTNSNGEITVSALGWGEYTVVEIAPPAGYSIDYGRHEQRVTINATNLQGNLTFYNAEIPEDVFDPSSLSGVKGIVRPSVCYAENDVITYYITIVNNDSVASDEVVITDTVPAGTTLDDAKNAVVNGNVLSWTFSSLAPGESKTVEFSVRINALPQNGYTAEIRNTAYVNGTATNEVVSNVKKGIVYVNFVDEAGNVLAEQVVYEGLPGTAHGDTGPKDIDDYVLIRTDSNDVTGNFIEGVITVTHVYRPVTGTLVIEATNADGTVLLPGAQYELYKDGVKYNDTIYSTDENGQVTIPDVPTGNYTLVEVKEPDGYLRTETPAETYFATISAENLNGKITVPHGTIPATSFEVKKLVSITGENNSWVDEVTVPAGTKVFFKIQVVNTGETEIDLSELLLTDVFMLNDEEISTDIWASQLNNETFTGIMSVDEFWESGIMSYDTADTLGEDDQYVNTATVANQSDSVIVNITSRPDPEEADLTVTKTAAVDTAAPGSTIEYLITVSNTGSVDLHNIVVNDALDGAWTIDAADDNISITEDGNVKINELAVGDAPISLKYLFTVPQNIEVDTKVDNVVTATADEASDSDIASVLITSTPADDEQPDDEQPDDTPDDDKPSNGTPDTEGKGNPAYTVKKTANVTSAKPGDTIYYTITVTNTGDCTLQDLVVADKTMNWSTTIAKLEVGETWTSPASALPYTIPANATGSHRNVVSVNNEYLPETEKSFTIQVLGATDTSNNSNNNDKGNSNIVNGSTNNNVPNTQDTSSKYITAAITLLLASGAIVLVMIPFMVRLRVRKKAQG